MGYGRFGIGSLCCFVDDLNREDLLFRMNRNPSVSVFVFCVLSVCSLFLCFFFVNFIFLKKYGQFKQNIISTYVPHFNQRQLDEKIKDS